MISNFIPSFWEKLLVMGKDEEGQAMTEYAILMVMILTSTIFVIQVFPSLLRHYYYYTASVIGLPIG